MRAKPFNDLSPDSNQMLLPFKQQGRFAACDIHGRLLLIDADKEVPTQRKETLFGAAVGHVMPDDRGLLILKDRNPQRIILLNTQSPELGETQDHGLIKEWIDAVDCGTAVAPIDVSSSIPYLFMLYRNGLLARRILK